MKHLKVNRLITPFLLVCFLTLSIIPVAQANPTLQRNREAGKKKAAKRIGIGSAIGAGLGGLIGGRKGALIGAGAGAGGGAVYHVHKKRLYKKRSRR
jgi:hypothetical protein